MAGPHPYARLQLEVGEALGVEAALQLGPHARSIRHSLLCEGVLPQAPAPFLNGTLQQAHLVELASSCVPVKPTSMWVIMQPVILLSGQGFRTGKPVQAAFAVRGCRQQHSHMTVLRRAWLAGKWQAGPLWRGPAASHRLPEGHAFVGCAAAEKASMLTWPAGSQAAFTKRTFQLWMTLRASHCPTPAVSPGQLPAVS